MVETNLPIILLKDIIVFPYNEIRMEFSLDNDKLVLSTAEKYHDNHILLVNLVNPKEESPTINDLPKVAILGKIKSKIELPNGIIRVVIVGIDRVEIINYIENEHGNVEAFVIPTKEFDYNELEASALKRILLKDLNNYIDNSSYMSNNVLGRISEVNTLNKMADIIVSELPLSYEEKLKYVEKTNPMIRIKLIIEDLAKELETIEIENKIESSLKLKLEQDQKEYILKEKIRLMKEELGEFDLKESDIDKLKDKIYNLKAPDRIKKRLESEVKKYELSNINSPETSIIRGYIDWLLSLPWEKSTVDNYNIEKVKQILDNSHFGLDKVKERIIEYIAVKKRTNNLNSPIICLVGPPGVGKTSLAKSIAKALDKRFVKISVGGINDEAEIMGHRRTYIGANPGKIIQGIKKAEANNPLFLIDEIDKMTKDYHGDPASALLDVLDKEQNNIFIDNYLEEEYDLSNVMFTLTANSTATIPEPLKDRLEIIELSSYTILEKLNICKEHLIPKLLESHNMEDKIVFSDEIILFIIKNYTKEAGVRELERQIASIIRKVILELEDNQKLQYILTEDDILKYLGKEKYLHQFNDQNTKSGVVNAMAYTSYGGEILKVSVTSYPGKGEIILTGHLGDVMKESVYLALSYIKTNSDLFGIDYHKFKDTDFHFHVEEGAIPKDGPSAGITLTTALISLLKDEVIGNDISMTGEMTLRGKILPIGGLKEKLIACTTNEINKVFIPKSNESDLAEIEDYIKEKLKIILVDDYQDIYHKLFKKKKKSN